MTIQCNIREIRDRLNISQIQMARDIEMNPKDLCQIEKGRNATIKTAMVIFEYLKKQIPDLRLTDIWPEQSETEAA